MDHAGSEGASHNDDDSCSDSGSNCVPVDKRYRQLSFQLFGAPQEQQRKFYKGPFVDLTGELLRTPNDSLWTTEGGSEDVACQKKTKKKIRGPLALGRCLICYSLISREDRKNVLGHKFESLPARIKEKSGDLMEFLRIISSPVGILQRSTMTPSNTCSTKSVFENATKRLITRPWCLCGTCNATCEQLLSKHRALKKLQQEVDELQKKFITAVKLSKAIAEMDPEIKKSTSNDDDQDEGNQVLSSKSAHERTKITLRMTVDMVRRCLTGGKWAWLAMRSSLMEHVDFDTEVKRNPEPLTMLKMSEKTDGSIKNLAASAPVRENQNETREKKNRQPCGPRRKKSDLASTDREPLHEEIKIKTDNSIRINIKQENTECSMEDVDVSGTVPGVNTAKRKRGPYGPRRKKDKTGRGKDNRETIPNEIDIKMEPDVNLNNESVDKVRQDCASPQVVDDYHNDTFMDDHFNDDLDDDFVPPEGSLREVNLDESPVGEPATDTAALTQVPLSEDKDKIAKKRMLARQRYRETREKYPDMTEKQIRAHLRKIRHLGKPQRKNRTLKKGTPGMKRRPISELATSKSNLSYIKWRMTHGQTMTLPEYTKMRREQLIKEQNLSEDGLPSRANKEGSGLKNLCWTEKDGQELFRGTVVNKNEEGKYMCPFCDRYEPAKRRMSVGLHINRHHVDVSKGYPCDQCDSKFYYNADLLVHIKDKHSGGYQCEICGANLANRSSLFYHKRVKPHVCEHCGKGFATRKDMTIHVRRHTGERPFVCHVCAESFVEKQSMKLHIRRKHPEEVMATEVLEKKPSQGAKIATTNSVVTDNNDGEDGQMRRQIVIDNN